MRFFARKRTGRNGGLSEFMRNASAREHKRVMMKVIDYAIEAQKETMRRAQELRAQREREARAETEAHPAR